MRPAVSSRTGLLLRGAVAALLVAGCGKQGDPVAQAEKKEAAKGIAAPGIAETKAKETPPSILPAGEGTWQPPGIVAAK